MGSEGNSPQGDRDHDHYENLHLRAGPPGRGHDEAGYWIGEGPDLETAMNGALRTLIIEAAALSIAADGLR